MNNRTAIVTGAGGFLGSHLAERLANLGYTVIGVDNFCTGHRENEAVFKSFGERHIFFEKDVTKPWTWLNEIPADVLKNLTHVFHFASPASPPLYQKLSVETIWVNTIGLENAIHTADRYGARVIFASTSEVYGDPAMSPQPESYWGNVNSYGQRSCYDEAKRMGEALIFSYNERNKTQHGLIRIFNTYGPRMNPHDGRVIINFIKQAVQNDALTVYGDGKQTRSFCYVSDLIDGLLHYANSTITTPMNFGNDKEFSILELAETVNKLFCQGQNKISFKELPADDPKLRRPDLTFAKLKFPQWSPEVPLTDGIERTYSWLKQTPLL